MKWKAEEVPRRKEQVKCWELNDGALDASSRLPQGDAGSKMRSDSHPPRVARGSWLRAPAPTGAGGERSLTALPGALWAPGDAGDAEHRPAGALRQGGGSHGRGAAGGADASQGLSQQQGVVLR